MLTSVGYSKSEIKEVLTRRQETKELRVEIGKLKSYIDELEFENKKLKNKLAKKFAKK